MATDAPKLGWYTVESLELNQGPYGRIVRSNILAVSVEDALFLERASFGYPFFKVLRAWPKKD